MGIAWFDNLQLFIDGVPIAKAPLKPVLPLEKDHQFDHGSAITLPLVNERQIDNLNLLGKVWGFLKYHHPSIAQGKYNWDYELFRVLPKFLAANDRPSRDKVLSAWVTSLGEVALCRQCQVTAANAVLKPDLNWIEQFELSETLQRQLHYLYDNRHQGANYYVTTEASAGNPIFENEKRYQDMQYPDVGFRLLALYRYWNIIHYYFPSKHLSDKNWNGVLKQYIARFVAAKDELAYEQAVAQLIAEIDDSHATVNMANALEAWKGNYYPPVTLKFIAGKLIVTDYYNQALKHQSGLKIGDVISKINDFTINDIVNSKQSYYSASNRSALLRDIADDILRANSKTITLTYIRDKQEVKHSLGLYHPRALKMGAWYRGAKDGKGFKLLSDNIGYINLRHLQTQDVSRLKKQLINTQGIIIDMRKYPGSFSLHSLGAFFTSEATEFAKVTHVNLDNPGEVVFFDESDKTDDESITYRNKVVVLVNENTQSLAEYYAMAMQAGDNTTVIGSTTAGADGNVSRIYLPGNIATAMSGLGIYYPDDRHTQRVGIVPDIVVNPTLVGIKVGRDELLERAIRFITQ
ncbi:MAG: peptidase S41 [Psychrobium sp.]|nr:peptidase S41 [Psychrobium sp.]